MKLRSWHVDLGSLIVFLVAWARLNLWWGIGLGLVQYAFGEYLLRRRARQSRVLS